MESERKLINPISTNISVKITNAYHLGVKISIFIPKYKIFLIPKYPYSNAIDFQFQKINYCETVGTGVCIIRKNCSTCAIPQF